MQCTHLRWSQFQLTVASMREDLLIGIKVALVRMQLSHSDRIADILLAFHRIEGSLGHRLDDGCFLLLGDDFADLTQSTLHSWRILHVGDNALHFSQHSGQLRISKNLRIIFTKIRDRRHDSIQYRSIEHTVFIGLSFVDHACELLNRIDTIGCTLHDSHLCIRQLTQFIGIDAHGCNQLLTIGSTSSLLLRSALGSINSRTDFLHSLRSFSSNHAGSFSHHVVGDWRSLFLCFNRFATTLSKSTHVRHTSIDRCTQCITASLVDNLTSCTSEVCSLNPTKGSHAWSLYSTSRAEAVHGTQSRLLTQTFGQRLVLVSEATDSLVLSQLTRRGLDEFVQWFIDKDVASSRTNGRNFEWGLSPTRQTSRECSDGTLHGSCTHTCIGCHFDTSLFWRHTFSQQTTVVGRVLFQFVELHPHHFIDSAGIGTTTF